MSRILHVEIGLPDRPLVVREGCEDEVEGLLRESVLSYLLRNPQTTAEALTAVVESAIKHLVRTGLVDPQRPVVRVKHDRS